MRAAVTSRSKCSLCFVNEALRVCDHEANASVCVASKWSFWPVARCGVKSSRSLSQASSEFSQSLAVDCDRRLACGVCKPAQALCVKTAGVRPRTG